jgi:hypothetical protein
VFIIERQGVFPAIAVTGGGGEGVQFGGNAVPIFFILKVSILTTELKGGGALSKNINIF